MSWRTFTRDELERQYSPSSCLDHPLAVEIQAYIDRSAEARDRCAADGSPLVTIDYGTAPSQTIDVVVPPPDRRPAVGAPLVCYFHGGYWQELSKRESFFAAHDAIRRGWAFAAVDYTLAPAATMGEIVAECRVATRELVDRAPSLGLDPDRFLVAGSSAGAQLAAMVALPSSPDWTPAGTVLVSGIYDLQPLLGTYVNDALGLDDVTARRNSPLCNPPFDDLDGFPATVIAHGDNETSEFKRQSSDFADRLHRFGVDVATIEVHGRNHFDVVLELCNTDSGLGRHTGALVGASATDPAT